MVNSIAILSDAVHDLGDSLSLGTAWFLERKSGKPANERFSFGYRRFSLFGALINSLVLIAGSVYVVTEAIDRIIEPQHSNAQGMLYFAIAGVLVNGYAAWKLSKGKNMNQRVVTWHLLEDVLGWVAVLIVAIVLQFWDNHYLDPVLSLLITLFILFNVFRRLRETLLIFLQGIPRDISLEEIKANLLAIEGIESLHHTHIWSLDGEKHVFSTHVKLDPLQNMADLNRVKDQIRDELKGYQFSHCTVETELNEENCSMSETSEPEQ